MSGDDLMPCPFCGGQGHFGGNDEVGIIFVFCGSCGADGPSVDTLDGKQEHIAELWNKRFAPTDWSNAVRGKFLSGSPLAPPPDASSRSARQTDHSPTEAVKDGRATGDLSDE